MADRVEPDIWAYGIEELAEENNVHPVIEMAAIVMASKRNAGEPVDEAVITKLVMNQLLILVGTYEKTIRQMSSVYETPIMLKAPPGIDALEWATTVLEVIGSGHPNVYFYDGEKWCKRL